MKPTPIVVSSEQYAANPTAWNEIFAEIEATQVEGRRLERLKPRFKWAFNPRTGETLQILDFVSFVTHRHCGGKEWYVGRKLAKNTKFGPAAAQRFHISSKEYAALEELYANITRHLQIF